MNKAAKTARVPQAIAGAGFPIQRPLLDPTYYAKSTEPHAILALATAKLRKGDHDVWKLFAAIVHQHDVREAWLGLAVAHQLRNETELAGKALTHTLSHHAVTDVPLFAKSIVESLRAPGWCAVDCAGILTVWLAHSTASGRCLKASLDKEDLLLKTSLSGQALTHRLPNGWRQASEIKVSLDDVALLGSPIQVKAIVRVEGLADTLNGDLHGWAWHPNDRDRDPELSIVPLEGGPGISVVAVDTTITIVDRPLLALPRGFHIPADQMRRFNGSVRVCGPDGHNLMGSPLDPSADRFNAETTSRIVARLFPSIGTTAGAAARHELSLPSVSADVTGGPAQGGRKKRGVNVIVPVFGRWDLAEACLQSVMTNLPRWARVAVINDASPDPAVGHELAKFAVRHRITLLNLPANLGFPGAANVGMRHDAKRDVLLLNSDTLVPPGWLLRLREAAYSATDIGSATPISNDATILSYPSVEQRNAVPDLADTVRLDTLAQRANLGAPVEIPTAVGFCVYIKRDCLNATGLFREDVFAQGYGEENDFCIRARHLGWRHVAVPSVFVAHVGGQSFGSAKRHLSDRNMRRVNQLHPGYDALIQKFHSTDPMAEPRRRLDLERWKLCRTRARSVLLITHSRSGGVQRHIAKRAIALRAEGLRPIMLWPAPGRGGGGRDCILGDGPEGGTPNLRFAIPAELDLLARTLRADRPVRAEVHHTIGHDHRLFELFKLLLIPYEIFVHDYSSFCPRINLVGVSRRYCGEPEVGECEGCVSAAGSLNDDDISPRELRIRSELQMSGAVAVVVPSDDVAFRLRRHFPSGRPVVKAWEGDRWLPSLDPSPPAADGIRRVCVIGAIGVEKGYDVLLACARDAADRNLRLRFHLVGHSCDDARLVGTGTVHITGRYQEHETITLIRKQQAQFAWLPSVWPETWSYALTEAWQAGLNALVFDMGTPAERIRHTGRGWLLPLGVGTQTLNDRMLTLEPIEIHKKGLRGMARETDAA